MNEAVLVHARVHGGEATVLNVLRCARPQFVDPADAQAYGQWLHGMLRAQPSLAEAETTSPEHAQQPRPGRWPQRVLVACRRNDVILKRLELPGLADLPEESLASAVRLQMSRHVAFPMAGALVDYFAVPCPTAGAASVLAAVLPPERAAWLRRMASASLGEAKRARIVGIGISACGSAAVIERDSRRLDRATLLVSVGCGTTSVSVLESGRPVFIRSADVGLQASAHEPTTSSDAGADPTEAASAALPIAIEGPSESAAEDAASLAERVAVEVKRTWMGARAQSGPSGLDIGSIVVLGEPETVGPVAQACSAALSLEHRLVAGHEAIRFGPGLDATARTVALPLVALALEPRIAQPTIDFASPRRAPDQQARVRTRALLGVLGLIVVVGGLALLNHLDLSSAREQAGRVRAVKQDLEERYLRALLEQARLAHAKAYMGANVDWLSHYQRIADQLPDPPHAMLDEWRGRLESQVVFTPKDRSFFGGAWSSPSRVSLSIVGPTQDHALASAIRGRLLQSGLYRVKTSGPDAGDRFALDMVATGPALASITPAPRPEQATSAGPGNPADPASIPADSKPTIAP